MLITDHFVFIHLPKTGGTFVLKALDELYERLARKPGHPEPRCRVYESADIAGVVNGHNYARDIPAEYGHLDIVSVIRHPIDRYVSAYEYEYGEKLLDRPHNDLWLVQERFRGFPFLSFAEYLRYLEEVDIGELIRKTCGIRLRADIGVMTLNFLLCFCRRPVEFLEGLTDVPVATDDLLEQLFPVRFLHQERLNRVLYDLLVGYGYAEEDVSFVLDARRENVGIRRDGRPWAEYFEERTLANVMRKERLLFQLFPEYRLDGPGVPVAETRHGG